MTTTSNSINDILSPAGQARLKGKSGQVATGAASDDKPVKKKSAGRLVSEIPAGEKLAGKLSDIQIAKAESEVQSEAEKFGVPYIDLFSFPISGEALETVPENVCIEQKLVCFLNTGEQVRLATTNPKNSEIEKVKVSIEDALHAKIEVYLVSERGLKKALAQYAKLPKYRKPVTGVEIKEEELKKFQGMAGNFAELDAALKKVNITEMVTLIIAASLQANSSDIHVEAEEKEVKVRFRVDGLLHDAAAIDKESWPKVISRIKLLSGLKLNINDRPQDGRFSILLTNDRIDVRVSCLPTTWGESVVMRLLMSSAAGLQFEQLGLGGKSETDLKYQTERPNGMIVTTGPTGSGKTTTLYAVLNKLNKEDTKIITLEDPIEYKVEGLNQSQIDHSKGYSFADGLRSILRQDPDIIMVGELRDLETADVAINAALTGHLVISTIHTNSAAGAIPRFIAMGVRPFLLAPALNAVMGQRLVRKLCEKCKHEVQLEPELFERAKKILDEIPANHPDRPDLSTLKFYEAEGCSACLGLGYKGRIGIYEIMVMTKEIEAVILSGQVSEYIMQDLAVKGGMITMAQDGLLKSLKGVTSVAEVFRVSE